MRHSRIKGFTLVEVMIGMVLTGILAIGLMGVWSMVGDQFFRSTIRQKAIFVLHGHMDRISALYRYHEGYPAIHTAVTTTGIVHAVDSNTPISGLVIEETDTAFVSGQVLLTPAGENIVWIDNIKSITGSLHWSLAPLPDPCYANISNSNCYLLTLNLEYPYRFTALTSPANAITEWGTRETLTLQTIVGRRL
jgi:prepilin-type N-terminal cleavage/methylation domain-containing protein